MINKNTAISLYFNMLRIRMTEEKIAKLYPEKEMRCPVHLCIGQEAIAVGVCANLFTQDYIMSNHRSHGHYLAKGGNIKAMFAEIYGRATGCAKGKGGSMHLVDMSVNMMGATPIVGGIIPVAVGIAFGTVLKKEDRITAVFFGDAATEEGVFAESLNFASLKKLPIVFVCENNFFSVYSPLSVRQPKERNNLSIANAYGIKGAKGDGADVRQVYQLAEEAVTHVRSGQGPYYLEFQTYRWLEHCGPNYDNNLGYRDESEFMKWKNRCSIQGYEKVLLNDRILVPQQISEIKSRIKAEVEEAVQFAKSCPFPDANDAFLDVYADTELR